MLLIILNYFLCYVFNEYNYCWMFTPFCYTLYICISNVWWCGVNNVYGITIWKINKKKLAMLISGHTLMPRLVTKARPSPCQVRCHHVHISLKRRYSNNNGSVPIVWARGTLRFCLCPPPLLTMRPGNKWAFISPLFVSEYRCLLSSFDCSELFRGHIVVDSS